MSSLPQLPSSFDRMKTVLAAKGEAEKIRNVGGAEASAIEAIGKAEAEMMRMKAAAYKQYGDAAMMSLVLEALPKVYCPLPFSVPCVHFYAVTFMLNMELSHD